MKLTDRINDLFNKFNVQLKAEVNLEAQGVLENGTVVYTDAASFVEGADVFVLNEEGERIPLPDGDYTFEDGTQLRISNGGKVARSASSSEDSSEGEGEGSSAVASAGGNPSKGGKKPVPPKKAPPKKKGKSAQRKLEEEEESNVNIDVEVDEKDKEEMMDDAYIIDLINRVLDERFPQEVEAEEVVEEEEEKKEEIEMSLVKRLRKEITELKTQAASEGVKRVKKQKAPLKPVDLTNLSNNERITALYNQFNK